MRPGQQNKRGRGRNNNNNNGGSSNNSNSGNNNGNNNNNNRRGANPLTRSYDSSGPDVKIRGTAQHIAEKYATLARDAMSSGDRVVAENYLQHAEHYNRIIASAQAQMQDRFQRDDRSDFNDRDGNERDQDDNDNFNDDMPSASEPQYQQPVHVQPQPAVRAEQPQRRPPQQQPQPQHQPQPVIIDGSGPQPVIAGLPAEVVAEEEAPTGTSPRAPRRRGTARPRRQPRRSEGGTDDAGSDDAGASDETPALADVVSE